MLPRPSPAFEIGKAYVQYTATALAEIVLRTANMSLSAYCTTWRSTVPTLDDLQSAIRLLHSVYLYSTELANLF